MNPSNANFLLRRYCCCCCCCVLSISQEAKYNISPLANNITIIIIIITIEYCFVSEYFGYNYLYLVRLLLKLFRRLSGLLLLLLLCPVVGHYLGFRWAPTHSFSPPLQHRHNKNRIQNNSNSHKNIFTLHKTQSPKRQNANKKSSPFRSLNHFGNIF